MLACKTIFRPSDTPNHMKINRSLKSAFYSCLCIFSVLLVWAGVAHCQVQVSIAPPLHQKFSDNNGVPLASGFLYSYTAGTTSLQATYVDSSGTIQNPNPIPLDSTGAPSNGSVQTQIWILNNAYKFCAYNAGLVLQWCSDNIQGQLELVNLSNEWPFQQTFDQPIIITPVDNQIVLGPAGVTTTLDFPPPTGPITLHFPSSTDDTMVGRASVDTLLNKNLIVPQINGVPVNNTPGTYFNIANAPASTFANDLTILTGSGQATVATVGVTHGVIGICINSCGATGTATIQQSGEAFCNFDGATSQNDYVQISSIANGACHDTGSTNYPVTNSGQIIGKVIQAIGSGAGVILLFGGDINPVSTVYPAIIGFTAQTGAGTAPTITCTACHDNGGVVSVTPGTSPAGSNANLVTVNFSATYARVWCTISPANVNSIALGTTTQVGVTTTISPPGVTIFTGASALSAATAYQWYYNCTFN